MNPIACFIRIGIGAVLTAAMLLTTAEVAAQDMPWARREQNRVGLDFDIWPFDIDIFGTDVDIVSLTWGIPMQFRLTDHVYLNAGIHWTYLGIDEGAEDGFAFGHIPIGAYYADTPDPIFAWWAGGDVSIPTHLAAVSTADFDDVEEIQAGLAAVATRAYHEPNRFAVLHFPMRIGGGIELHPIDWFFLRTWMHFGQYIPLNGDPGIDYEFIWEWPLEAEFRHPVGFGGGTRFQQIFPLTNDPITGNDLAQLGLEWFIGYESPDPGVTARLGWMWALDEQLGFAFEGGRVMSVRLSVGGHW